jgi:Predicted phosphatase homologous to the C-terminal domain of histone macroH2A1
MVKSFEIVLGDITKFKADAIVNAANTTLLGGGGVDGAIHRAAGPELLAECRKLRGCATGEAKITNGCRLPAKYVIHTPGPIWNGGTHHEDELLQNSYRNSLKLAEANRCHTVAFPSISTGVYHFPLERAAAIAVRTIRTFLKTSANVSRVTMVCFDVGTKAAYEQADRNKRI